MAGTPVRCFSKACGERAECRAHHSDWNIQMLLEGGHYKDHSFSVTLKSQSAKLVFSWFGHLTIATAKQLRVFDLVFTAYPVLAGYEGCSSNLGRTEQHCCHVLGGEKTSFDSEQRTGVGGKRAGGEVRKRVLGRGTMCKGPGAEGTERGLLKLDCRIQGWGGGVVWQEGRLAGSA